MVEPGCWQLAGVTITPACVFSNRKLYSTVVKYQELPCTLGSHKIIAHRQVGEIVWTDGYGLVSRVLA